MVGNTHVCLSVHLDIVEVAFDNAILEGMERYRHTAPPWAKVVPGKFKAIVQLVEFIIDKDSQGLEDLGGRVGMSHHLVLLVVPVIIKK